MRRGDGGTHNPFYQPLNLNGYLREEQLQKGKKKRLLMHIHTYMTAMCERAGGGEVVKVVVGSRHLVRVGQKRGRS
jgi:hypothetical protein